MDPHTEAQLAKAVGVAISRKRVEVGFTQEAVAEALEVGPIAISRMERGVVIPPLSRLVELAELFNCPVESFFGKATGLPEDSARSIATLLEGLERPDRQFIVELVEASANHLKTRKK